MGFDCVALRSALLIMLASVHTEAILGISTNVFSRLGCESTQIQWLGKPETIIFETGFQSRYISECWFGHASHVLFKNNDIITPSQAPHSHK